jgi:hypothetical protein
VVAFDDTESLAEQVGLVESLGLFRFDAAVGVSSCHDGNRTVTYL